MPYFLIEIPMTNARQPELARAARLLEAAQARLRSGGDPTRTIVAAIRDNDLLFYVIEAARRDVATRLVAVAQLPAARILEIRIIGE